MLTYLALNAAKFSIPFGRIKRQSQACWPTEVEEAVSERCKAFAAAHRSDENRQAYISASRHASSVIAKATEAERRGRRLALFSYLNSALNLCIPYCVGVSGSSLSSFNFPNCPSPRQSALVFADFLRSHFSVFQPKALRSKVIGYLSGLRRATCAEESHLSFCSSFSPDELPCSLPLAQIKLPIPC